jgi:competence ComEA-like helix-hairpin-helix protein
VAAREDRFKHLKLTKREKRGSVILLTLLVAFMFLPKFYSTYSKPLSFEFTEEERSKIHSFKDRFVSSKQFERKKNNRTKNSYQKKEFKFPVPTSPFDPDTMSSESWQILGLSERQAEVLISYKNRSGGFYHVDQLYSAYVLDSNRVNSWKPFLVFNKKRPLKEKIEINSATAEDFRSLRGIGEKLSERIVNYREKLGGFASVEQIAEVYGLPPETFESIRTRLTVDTEKLKQIDINRVEMKELASHPYFTFHMAKLIVNYRSQHGLYTGMDDLLKSKAIEIQDVKKVEPYINFAP